MEDRKSSNKFTNVIATQAACLCRLTAVRLPCGIMLSSQSRISETQRLVCHTLEHCRMFYCPFNGCSNPLDTSTSFRRHIIESHKTHGLPDSINILVNSCSRIDISRVEGKCPVCCEVEIKTSRQYQSHVGNHLEQLALFVLPNMNEDDSDVELDLGATESETEQDDVDDQEHVDNEIDDSAAKGEPEEGPSKDEINLITSKSELEDMSVFYAPGRHARCTNCHTEQHRTVGDRGFLYLWSCVSPTSLR